MIQLYRVIGFFLLVAGVASLFSLIALLVNQLREPFLYLLIACSIGLGIASAVVYYRKTDDKEWVLGLLFVISFGVSFFVGSAIQWVR